jgi:hypothetical protein
MASRMTTFYGPQITQVKEELLRESSLDWTLMQHLHDEDLEPREVCPRLKVEPLRVGYYRISSNSCTLVILLQVNFIFGDQPEIVCEGFYETKDISIFASLQFLVLDIIVGCMV